MQRRKIFRFFDRYFGIPLVIFLALFTRRKRRLPIENIRNILIIKLAAIGDAILLVPVLRKLKNSFPDVKITFMCSDVNRVFVERIPYVDIIMNCKVYDFIRKPLYLISFLKQLRKIKYDLIVDAGQWERINSILTIFARKYYSVGFNTKGQLKHIINDFVVEHIPDKHEVENFMDLLMPLGIIPINGEYLFDDTQLEFFITEEHRKFRREFWKKNNLADKIVICFQPGCGLNGKPKQWDVENYVDLAKRLKEIYPELFILITGTRTEKQYCEILNNAVKDYSINICSLYPIELDAVLIEKSKLIVCSNTGILHIAASVGTKTIGLHGPHNDKKWGAYDKNAVVIRSDKFCSPCLYLGHDFGCRVPTCMKHITVDQVYIAVRKALQPEYVVSVN